MNLSQAKREVEKLKQKRNKPAGFNLLFFDESSGKFVDHNGNPAKPRGPRFVVLPRKENENDEC